MEIDGQQTDGEAASSRHSDRTSKRMQRAAPASAANRGARAARNGGWGCLLQGAVWGQAGGCTGRVPPDGPLGQREIGLTWGLQISAGDPSEMWP